MSTEPVAQEIWEHAQYISEILDTDASEEADYLRAYVAHAKATAAVADLGHALGLRVREYLTNPEDDS